MPDVSVLEVRLNGQPVGTLTLLPGDRILFSFTQHYMDEPERPTLSLSFKDAFGGLIADVAPTQTRLPPFFSNLLPEGAMREYLAQKARTNPAREFLLISALGRDLPGALTILPAEHRNLPPGETDAQDVEDAKTRSEDILRFSLAGVQLKFSAVKEASGGLTIPAHGVGGAWIVKLPSTVYRDVPENEFAMMELARRIGIDVPETALKPVEAIKGIPDGINVAGGNAFVIRRFDRGPRGETIHIEDFAQVFGVYPNDKYGKASYRSIARVLWIETGEEGIAEFLRRLTFNALIGNGDMHLKNWSLIYRDGRTPMLAPAYDFVSTIAYIANDRLALNFVDSKDFASVSANEFVRFAAKAGLPEKLTRDTARETAARFREVWRKHSVDVVPENLHSKIAAHVKTLSLWME